MVTPERDGATEGRTTITAHTHIQMAVICFPAGWMAPGEGLWRGSLSPAGTVPVTLLAPLDEY